MRRVEFRARRSSSRTPRRAHPSTRRICSPRQLRIADHQAAINETKRRGRQFEFETRERWTTNLDGDGRRFVVLREQISNSVGSNPVSGVVYGDLLDSILPRWNKKVRKTNQKRDASKRSTKRLTCSEISSRTVELIVVKPWRKKKDVVSLRIQKVRTERELTIPATSISSCLSQSYSI